jgi:hypothetical protein
VVHMKGTKSENLSKHRETSRKTPDKDNWAGSRYKRDGPTRTSRLVSAPDNCINIQGVVEERQTMGHTYVHMYEASWRYEKKKSNSLFELGETDRTEASERRREAPAYGSAY